MPTPELRFEIVLRPIDDGWTWTIRLNDRTIVKRGRAGNLCVAALDADDALKIQQGRIRKIQQSAENAPEE